MVSHGTWSWILDHEHPPLCFDERNRGLGEYRGVIHDTKMPRTVSRYPICRCRGRGVGTRADFCSTGPPLGQNDWNASGTRPKYWSAFSMKGQQKTKQIAGQDPGKWKPLFFVYLTGPSFYFSFSPRLGRAAYQAFAQLGQKKTIDFPSLRI